MLCYNLLNHSFAILHLLLSLVPLTLSFLSFPELLLLHRASCLPLLLLPCLLVPFPVASSIYRYTGVFSLISRRPSPVTFLNFGVFILGFTHFSIFYFYSITDHLNQSSEHATSPDVRPQRSIQPHLSSSAPMI